MNWDTLGLLQQLGIAPGGAPAADAAASPVANTQAADAANKAVARRYWEDVFSDGNMAVADEIAALDWTIHNPGLQETERGPAAVKAVTGHFRAGFPDIRVTVDEIVAEGDRVGLRVTARGTHTGVLMGIPLTGRQVVLTGMAIDRMANGKVVERWGVFDALGLLQQLGVIHALGPAPVAAVA